MTNSVDLAFFFCLIIVYVCDPYVIMSRLLNLTVLFAALLSSLALAQEGGKKKHWSHAKETTRLRGVLEFAQIHVVHAVNEQRDAPASVADRETEAIFTPYKEMRSKIKHWHPMVLNVFDSSGKLIVRVDARPPKELHRNMEGDDLPLYSTKAWSATIPWYAFREGNKLAFCAKVTKNKQQTIYKYTLKLNGLGAPHVHTLSRVKMIVFGNETDRDRITDFETFKGKRILQGMHAVSPFAETRWVDSVWKLPYIIVTTVNGPKKVYDEATRRDVLANDDDIFHEPRWAILKHHGAMRISMADQGRGLSIVNTGAENSPFSLGTVISMGWAMSVPDPKTNEAFKGWKRMGQWPKWGAAAWTGWCAMHPGDECGNTLVHELGHSYTMHHFTGNANIDWDIADEYPGGGISHENLPWGYDSVKRKFKTWYKAASFGEGKQLQGKNDPMNGGEWKDLGDTCYPQFTPYHGQKAFLWSQSSPTILKKPTDKLEIHDAFKNVDKDGMYIWDKASGAYVAEDHNKHSSLPVKAADVPVATFVGTLASSSYSDASQIYPPRFSSYGNVFEDVDPFYKAPKCDPEGLVAEKHSCNSGAKVSSAGDLDACRADVQKDSRCLQVMYSRSYSFSWGCYCCTAEGIGSHPNWSIFQRIYRKKTRTASPTRLEITWMRNTTQR